MNTTPDFPANTPNSSNPDDSAPASSETNLLDDTEYLLYQASGGKRFVNYLIDTVIFYFAWRLFVARLFGTALYYLHFPGILIRTK